MKSPLNLISITYGSLKYKFQREIIFFSVHKVNKLKTRIYENRVQLGYP